MATFRFLSGTNGFIPAATGQVIAFVRDPKKFRVNLYAQFVNAPQPIGAYFVIERDPSVRIPTDAEFAWEDGDVRPYGRHNLVRHKVEEFRCERRNYGATLGEQAAENNDYKALQYLTGVMTSQAWTNRTQRVIDLLENTANWPTGHVQSANELNQGAGDWANASDNRSDPNYNAIRKSILRAARRIELDTNGQVTMDDLVLVVSPGLAEAMSNSAEIHSYVKQSPFAWAQITGDKPGFNSQWGLPDHLYGVKIVVENSPVVDDRPVAAGTEAALEASPGRNYAKADTSAVLVSRAGGIDGGYNVPSFSTVQLYFHKYEAAVESFYNERDKLHEVHVVDMFDEVLAAPVAGMLITGTLPA